MEAKVKNEPPEFPSTGLRVIANCRPSNNPVIPPMCRLKK